LLNEEKCVKKENIIIKPINVQKNSIIFHDLGSDNLNEKAIRRAKTKKSKKIL
jgi:hypothetical protein